MFNGSSLKLLSWAPLVLLLAATGVYIAAGGSGIAGVLMLSLWVLALVLGALGWSLLYRSRHLSWTDSVLIFGVLFIGSVVTTAWSTTSVLITLGGLVIMGYVIAGVITRGKTRS